MCEIFPEVESCCFVASVRVGMLFIAVIAITSGAVGLGVVEQRTNVGYSQVMSMYKNVTHMKKPKQALSELSNFISSSVSAISVMYMFSGVLLLFATLTDQEGLAQIFVWLIFLCIVIGSVCILAIGFECVIQSKCILGHMDWLSAAICLLLMVAYLIVWFYFICVVNSYVLNGYS